MSRSDERTDVEPTQEQPVEPSDDSSPRDARASGGAYAAGGLVPEQTGDPETSPGIPQEAAPAAAEPEDEQAQ